VTASAVATPRAGTVRTARTMSASELGAHAVLIGAVVVSVYPMLLMLLNSFKTDAEVLRNPAGWPIAFTFQSYINFLQYQRSQSVHGFLNSVFISSVSTVIAVILAALAAFVSRWNDYLWPRIVVTSADVQPIMTLLPDIRDPTVGFFIPWRMVMAGCVLVMLPLEYLTMLAYIGYPNHEFRHTSGRRELARCAQSVRRVFLICHQGGLLRPR
jgi:ABC-type glycerol-3-phosphate transport system permease component